MAKSFFDFYNVYDIGFNPEPVAFEQETQIIEPIDMSFPPPVVFNNRNAYYDSSSDSSLDSDNSDHSLEDNSYETESASSSISDDEFDDEIFPDVVTDDIVYDFNQYFAATGRFPISQYSSVDYFHLETPILREMRLMRAEYVAQQACKPYCSKLSVNSMGSQLSTWAETDGLKFDVFLIGGCLDYDLSLQTLKSLPIARLASNPALLFIWVPSFGYEAAFTAMKSWGFHCEELISFATISPQSKFFPPQKEEDQFTKTTWQCIMAMKGDFMPLVDRDLIACGADSDIIIENGQEPDNIVPEQIYMMIENFCLLSRRIHIVPGEVSAHVKQQFPIVPRPGWVMMSPDVLEDNFTAQEYVSDMEQRGNAVIIDIAIDNLSLFDEEMDV